MSLILDGSTDALQKDGALGLSYKAVVAGWAKCPNDTQQRTMACCSVDLSDINFAAFDQHSAGGRTFTRFVGTDSIAVVAAGVTVDAWVPWVGLMSSAALKSFWMAIANTDDDTTNNGAMPAFDRFLIGCRYRTAGPENFWAGRLASISVHDADLISDMSAFVAAHGAGEDPATLEGCINRMKLIDSSEDDIGGWTFANVGTPTYDAADNPTINYSTDDWASISRTISRSLTTTIADRPRIRRGRR